MSKPTSYYGVILAAGTGSRIRPLSLSYPKPLLPICNKPIIQYQIENMIDLGIKDIFIVCGYLKEKLQEYLTDGTHLGARIQYIEQDRPLGIAHALSKVERYVDRPFLLFLGDIFFVTRDLHNMIDIFERSRPGAVLAVKQEPRPEYIRRNYAVLLHTSGMVTRVIEKPRYTTNSLKGCGLYFFDLPIFDAVRNTPRTAMRDEYEITSSIQILIDDGYPVYPAEVVDWDMNITLVDDLLLCNLKMLELLKMDYALGNNVSLHPDAKVIRSVIGHNVVIESPITIQDTVIFPDTSLSVKTDLHQSLLANDQIFTLQRMP